MKTTLAFLSLILLFAACQTKEAKTETGTTVADTTTYPYTIKDYKSWEMNPDHKNTVVAMNAIKAFSALDTAALSPFIADSIHLRVDGYEMNDTRSNFLKGAQDEMSKYKSVTVKMQDMESVLSKDKKHEYVSLWYSQLWETKDGKKDSVNYFNDIKLKDGKIIEWSEYAQHVMPKK